jgi:thiol-disulfide isomerase/thioredoxin
MLLAWSGLLRAETPSGDAPKAGEPTDAKARKSFASAIDWERHGDYSSAMDTFRKANKQDGGHCAECLRRAYRLANSLGDFKNAEEMAREMLLQASSDEQKADAHFLVARSLQDEGLSSKKEKFYTASCDEFKTALALAPRQVEMHFSYGISLAHLHQDEAARAEFAVFLATDRKNPGLHARAERFVERIELARATMAPAFALTTLDGQHLSMDGLAGKVVLIDFWATWCGPCRQALPRIRQIARKFDGQPLVVLSISLDKDEKTWKEFVEKNGMSWPQYRDGGFGGQIARQFNVNAIPATFTIDADGVLEDQHVGDAEIEGKLKKLVARAADEAGRKSGAQ